jgi:DNA polymerase-3 subunit alpha
MTYDMANTDKLAEFRAEAQRSASRSSRRRSIARASRFDVEGNTIHYALAALKGVGREAVKAIVEARGDRPFRDLTDFAAGSIRARSTSACWRSLCGRRRVRRAGRQSRARACGVDAILAAAQRAA